VDHLSTILLVFLVFVLDGDGVDFQDYTKLVEDGELNMIEIMLTLLASKESIKKSSEKLLKEWLRDLKYKFTKPEYIGYG